MLSRSFALTLSAAVAGGVLVGTTPASAASAPNAGAAGPGSVRVAVTRLVHGRPVVHVSVAPDRAAAASAVAAAQADPSVVAATVDHRVHVEGSDPYRDRQWGLDALHIGATWGTSTGAGVTVAVVDTGVDGAHPDLAGQLVPGTDIVTGSGDGTTDPNGHGTHVAGIIAAAAGNGIGVAGTAPGAKVMPVRALSADGSGWDSDIANGIVWAVDHGARVINLSLGGPNDDPSLDTAVSYALGHDVVVVAAAGNAGAPCTSTVTTNCGDPLEYPGAIPGVVAVAAVDSTLAPASFSEHGPQVALAAPGVKVLSTYVPDSVCDFYCYMSGTSMAAPFVAASAALVRATDPAMSATQVVSTLETTATDLGVPGRDDRTGFGLVDPLAAVCAIGCTAPPPAASDTTAPTAWLRRMPAFTLARVATVSWRAADAGSGVASYDVRYRRAAFDTRFGGWTRPPAWQATTGTQGRLGLAAGYDYCVEVRATDHAGNVSAWSAPRCVARPLDDRAASAATRGWWRARATRDYMHTYTSTRRHDARLVRRAATFRRLAVIATRCPSCGSIAVYAGRTLVKRISLRAARVHRRWVFVLPRLPLHTRTVSLVVLSRNKLVQVDGLAFARQ